MLAPIPSWDSEPKLQSSSSPAPGCPTAHLPSREGFCSGTDEENPRKILLPATRPIPALEVTQGCSANSCCSSQPRQPLWSWRGQGRQSPGPTWASSSPKSDPRPPVLSQQEPTQPQVLLPWDTLGTAPSLPWAFLPPSPSPAAAEGPPDPPAPQPRLPTHRGAAGGPRRRPGCAGAAAARAAGHRSSRPWHRSSRPWHRRSWPWLCRGRSCAANAGQSAGPEY